MLASAVALLMLAQAAVSQNLITALTKYNETSKFRELATSNPTIITSLLAAGPGGSYTILVPSDNAFNTYQAQTGSPITSAGNDALLSTFKYHVLVSRLSKSNFTQPGGITVPTLLDDEIYNNRTAGAALLAAYGEKATGQVLYISKEPLAGNKLRVRQASSRDASARGGLGTSVGLKAVDGTFDGGNFQIVDAFLTTPKPCSKTIRANSDLTSLDLALNRSSIYPILDAAKNVTCLAPNTAAFAAAGSPDSKASQQDLIKALTFHTLPLPLYSDFIKDGMEITSLGNLTVRVTVKGDDIYFNDARVTARNVLTNNGIIHVLDKVMSPLNTSSTGTNPSTTTSATPASTSKSSSATTLVASAVSLVALGLLTVLLVSHLI